ncbi:MAG: secretin N-terminal domain-containing protein [Pseudohongiellaceae bacterium]
MRTETDIGRVVLAAVLSLVFSACSYTGARPAPDTAVVDNIQDALIAAEESNIEPVSEPPSPDVLEDLMPGLSVSDELLTPVEERFNIVANRENARDFFNNLVAGTDYGVAVNPRVEGEISISLPNVTIEEALRAVERTYGYQVERNGNIFQIRPPGLQTRIFTIDYLDVQRSGSSDVQVTSGSSGGMGGGGGLGGFGGGIGGGIGGVGGGFNSGIGGGFNSGVGGINSGLGGRGGSAGSFGGGGGSGGGGQVSTQTETDFWEDIEETLESIINIDEDGGESGSGLLAGLGGGGGGTRSVVVQPQVGMIMVTASAEELDRVSSYIESAQNILSREVTIQVQFLEVVLNKGYQTAIDFDTFGPGGADEGNNLVTGDFSSGSSDGSLDAASNPMAISTNFTDFNAVFRVLNSRGTTQVLSSPSLKVLNNQKAVFQDGDEEFFQTSTGSSTVTSGQTISTNDSNNLQPFFSGISMDITPQISAAGDITLHVHPTITTVNEQIKTISDEQVPLARTSVRELDSIIRAEDGKIVVLGGLAYERSIDDAAGVPVASDLPLVGGAFDQRSRRTVKSEFIILLRPIIASSESERRMMRESRERFEALEDDMRRSIDPFDNR